MKYWRIDDHTEIVEIVAEDVLTITYKDIDSGEETSMPREKFELYFEPYSRDSKVENLTKTIAPLIAQNKMTDKNIAQSVIFATVVQSIIKSYKEKQLKEGKNEFNLTNRNWLRSGIIPGFEYLPPKEKKEQSESIKELEKQYKQLVEKNEKLEKDREELETQLNMAKEENARLLSNGDSGFLEQIEKQNAEISRMKDEKDIFEEHINQLQKQLVLLQKDSEVNKEKLENKDKEIEIKCKEVDKLSHCLEQEKDLLKAKLEEAIQERNKILSDAKEEYEDKVNALKKEIRQQEVMSADIRKQFKLAKEDLEVEKRHSYELKQKLQTTINSLSKSDNENEELRIRIKELEAKNADVENRLLRAEKGISDEKYNGSKWRYDEFEVLKRKKKQSDKRNRFLTIMLVVFGVVIIGLILLLMYSKQDVATLRYEQNKKWEQYERLEKENKDYAEIQYRLNDSIEELNQIIRNGIPLTIHNIEIDTGSLIPKITYTGYRQEWSVWLGIRIYSIQDNCLKHTENYQEMVHVEKGDNKTLSLRSIRKRILVNSDYKLYIHNHNTEGIVLDSVFIEKSKHRDNEKNNITLSLVRDTISFKK